MKIGLVNRVYHRKDLMEKSEEFAGVIAEKSPVSVKMILRALNEGIEADLDTGLSIEMLSCSVCLSSEDFKEGVTAFLEKRKPEFKGR